MTYRIGFVGIKGGCGKTTISLNVALHLSDKYRVLYVDKDYLGRGSMLMGFKGEGFYRAITSGKGRNEYIYNVGNLTIFKLFSDPLRYYKLTNIAPTIENFYQELKAIYSVDYDIVIVDYGFPFSLGNPGNIQELEIFKEVRPDVKIDTVGVTDITNLEDTVYYMKQLTKEIDTEIAKIVINMIPALPDEIDYALKEGRRIEEIYGISTFVIPFDDELYTYSSINPKRGVPPELQDFIKWIEKHYLLE